jgi:hypothetical protein
VRPQNRTVEEILAELAGRAHGVVTRAELLGAGVTKAGIRSRLRGGGLIPIHSRCFPCGTCVPEPEARYMAAVKACADRSLLAGRAAAYLLGLLKRPPTLPEVLTASQRRPKGVLTRRARRTDLPDRTIWHGIPVTTVPRTLVDVAGELSEPELARTVHEAEIRFRISPGSIEAVLARRHNWPGARKLRRVLWGDIPVTLSRLECLSLAAVRDAALPLPETNRPASSRRVDCRWPEHRLTVELDSYRYHHTRHSWELDREREREARARGEEFRRYTWTDVTENRRSMLTDLRRLLRGA